MSNLSYADTVALTALVLSIVVAVTVHLVKRILF